MSPANQPKTSFIGLSYQGRHLYVLKPDTWEQMITQASQSFSLGREQVATMSIRYRPDIRDNSSPMREIDQEAWEGVRDGSGIHLANQESNEMQGTVPNTKPPQITKRARVTSITMPVEKRATKHIQPSRPATPGRTEGYPRVCGTIPADETRMQIFVKGSSNGRTVTVDTSRSATVLQLKEWCEARLGLPVERQRLLYGRWQLKDGRTLEYYNIQKESTVYIVARMVGGKPAIYLLSPRPLHDLLVRLELSCEWKFSVLYPPTEVLPSYRKGTRVRWTVDVQPDGTLTDKDTGLDCSYLFWEAEAQSPDDRLEEREKCDLTTFHPSAPHKFMQHTYKVLPFDELLPHLDSVLADLCLTTAMRTDFMVYWLPAFQRIRDRGLQIKFTFVPQYAFMKAARLSILGDSRFPATETRIFMLFTGVDLVSLPEDFDGREGPVDWIRHVGLDKGVMEDPEAFRVLEWGGMEQPTPPPDASGGALVLGSDPEVNAKVVLDIATDNFGATHVLCMQYRPASPKTPVPATVQDFFTMYQYVLDLGVMPRNIVFMGDSAGSNVVLGALHYLSLHDFPQPAGAAVFSPGVGITAEGVEKYRQSVAPRYDILDAELLKWDVEAYRPKGKTLTLEEEGYVAPINHPFRLATTRLFIDSGSMDGFTSPSASLRGRWQMSRGIGSVSIPERACRMTTF